MTVEEMKTGFVERIGGTIFVVNAMPAENAKHTQEENLKQCKSMEQLGKEDGTGAKGCLLSLIQFPIMLCLYHAIRQTAAVNVRTMLLPWLILPIATLLIQLLPQLYPYFHRLEPLMLQRPSIGMMVAMLIMNGMFICVIPSGIGLYYFMSGLFQAAEQFVYYQGRIHRLKSAE